MGKHRHQQHYRKPVVAALVVGAIGIPSVALACSDWPGSEERELRSTAASTTTEDRWGDANWYREWSSQQSGEPSAAPSTKPTATERGSKPDAPKHRGDGPSHKSQKPHKPKATATPEAPAARPSDAGSKPSTGSSKPTAGASKPPAAKPTPSAPASPSTPAATTPASGDVAKVVELVNAERGKAGCSPVTVNAALTKAAQAHSEDMAATGTMSHSGSNGSSPEDRITNAGYNWSTYGENVAYGYETPEKVMAGWMSSPGHKENILNCDFKEIGVGLAQPGSYWTQDFGTAR
ncbi:MULTISPECIES: CAP domain-containing protein [unclassified Streptomyces]|uniref:CAP domain-containing protein n=1 Tax=unclassified Streptomyces TaxID=2593676 RepID=UPI0035E33AE9